MSQETPQKNTPHPLGAVPSQAHAARSSTPIFTSFDQGFFETGQAKADAAEPSYFGAKPVPAHARIIKAIPAPARKRLTLAVKLCGLTLLVAGSLWAAAGSKEKPPVQPPAAVTTSAVPPPPAPTRASPRAHRDRAIKPAARVAAATKSSAPPKAKVHHRSKQTRRRR